jgi:catechol 2,3-dioxygenase-like lactoylglutathione lyase family enzyme
MIQTSGVDHVVLHVNDVQRSKKFYTEILGMTAYREDSGQVFLHAGQQGVALFKKQGDTPLMTGNDLNQLEKRGFAVSGRPGQDRCIYFRDPDGHRLQLMVRSS